MWNVQFSSGVRFIKQDIQLKFEYFVKVLLAKYFKYQKV